MKSWLPTTFVSPLASVYMWIGDLFIHREQVPVVKATTGHERSCSGVQTRIREMCPNALYVHCRSHNLNLVVTHSCKSLNPIWNIILDNMVHLTWFVCASANRKIIFLRMKRGRIRIFFSINLEAAEEEDESGQLWQQIRTFCNRSVKHVLILCESFSIKIEGKGSGDGKSKAGGHRRMVEYPEFIITLVVAHYVLSFLIPLTLFFQKTNCDRVIAFDEAPNTLNTLKELRTDEKFSELFERAQIIADTMEVVLQPKRRVGRQSHRDNPNVNSAEQQYTLLFLNTLTMNSGADFLVIGGK